MAQSKRKGTPAKGGGGNGAFYAVLGVIAIGGIIAIAYALTGRPGEAATQPVDLQVADARALYEQATPIKLGEDAAPVKVVEFADFQCPGCREFSLQVRPRIMPYIESGLAQLIFYDFPLGGSHVHSFLASRAARCAAEQPAPGGGGENAYWAMHDKLFQEQSTWSGERSVTDAFVTYAQEIGLDADAFESCLRSDKYADVVTANRMVGDQLGVNSTPTVLVNNRRIGGQSRYLSDMSNELVQALEDAKARYGATPEATPAGADTAGVS